MEQPNKAVISEGLNGLMLVQRGLEALQKQGAGAPTMGGLPTIADQARQAGEQALAPQQAQQAQQQPSMMPPPQGARAPEGGIAGIAQNAATGMGIKQMQDQQAQKAIMQMAMQQQQPGIAGLPAENMRGFAEGGVLGFAGDEEQGSEVKNKKVISDRDGILEALKLIGGLPLHALGALGKSVDAATRVATDVASLPITIPLNQYQKLSNQEQSGYTPFYDKVRPNEAQPEQAAAGAVGDLAGAGMASLAAPASTPAPARPAPARSPTAPAAAKPGPQPSFDLSSLQYGGGMPSTGMLAPAPATAESPEVAAILANEARKQALNKARPDFYAQNIAALDADKQARAEAAAQQQKREGFEGLMAMFAGGAKSGMGGMGEASTAFNRGIVAQRDAARQATLLDAQMRVKLGELEYARQIGDIDGQSSVMKDIAAIKRQMETVAAQKAAVDASLEGHRVQGIGQGITAQTAANRLAQELITGREGLASHERIAALQREVTGNRENLALFKAQAKNLDDAFKKTIAKRSFAPVKAKEEYTELVKEWDALAAQYGLDKKTAPPPPFEGGADAPAAALKYNPKTGKVE
jgi:hypothetical protein